MKFAVGPEQDLANTTGQLGFNPRNKGGCLFAAHRFTFS
jgi:hypothetical protein